MTQDAKVGAVVDFYNTHPINEQQILDKMRDDGLDLTAVTEEVLQNYDQDHFGGLDANESLASLAGINADSSVLDVCCGMGGPARYFAHKFGCRVTGVDLTQSRIDGAARLTRIAGLADRVEFQCANALAMPFEAKTFDVVISQEAFCHIPQKSRLVEECARVLKPGGCLAFTDIVTTAKTDDETRDRLRREMTFQELESPDGYLRALDASGCRVTKLQDLSDQWREILAERLTMYRSLRDQTVERFGEAHFRKWDDAYSFFVNLYVTGELGGLRLLAHRVTH